MGKLAAAAAMTSSMARVAARRLSRGPARPSWSFAFEALVDMLKRSAARINPLPTDEQSAAWLELSMFRPQPVVIEDVMVGATPAWWITPIGAKPERVMLYLHGGWYSSAALANYRELLGRLAVACDARVLAIEYRKAPQHPFPAAIEDTVAAWKWLIADTATSKIVVAGDSAGGGLTMALMLTLREQGLEQPGAASLICPWVDLATTGGSLVANSAFDWGVPEEVERRAAMYVGERDRRDPLVSAVFADLRGLPRMLVQIGGAEMLYDQAHSLAERARQHGVDVTLEVAPDMVHDWHMFAGLAPEGRTAIERIGTFVKKSR